MRLKLAPLLAASLLATTAIAQPAVGFYVDHRLDGHRFHKVLYQLGGTYDHATIQEGDAGQPGQSFRLRVASLKDQGPGHAIELWLHHGLDLTAGKAQRFALRGQGPCGTEEPESPQAEAVAWRGGDAFLWGSTYVMRNALTDANQDQDAAHGDSKWHRTLAPGTYGRFDGELVISSIDTVNQTIAGSYQFRAVRLITVGRDTWGQFQADCSDPATLRPDALSITEGQFKVQYCTHPPNPRNARTCGG